MTAYLTGVIAVADTAALIAVVTHFGIVSELVGMHQGFQTESCGQIYRRCNHLILRCVIDIQDIHWYSGEFGLRSHWICASLSRGVCLLIFQIQSSSTKSGYHKAQVV